ncbi:M48 family metalloprotease [Fervidicoccus fontis]|nr:M48 family metalloprotease [Fervidicoccus fontis]
MLLKVLAGEEVPEEAVETKCRLRKPMREEALLTNQIQKLVYIILYALANYNPLYTQRVNKLVGSSGIMVSGCDRDILPCGIACSIGLGGYGIIFVDKAILASREIPDEFKDFVLAHEAAHITHNHVLSRLITHLLAKISIEVLIECVRSLEKAKDVVDWLAGFAATSFWFLY